MKKQIFLLIAIVCTSMAFAQIDEVKVKEIGAFIPFENKNTNYLSSLDFSVDKDGNSFFYGDVYGKLGFVKLNKTKDKFDIDSKSELVKSKYLQTIVNNNNLYVFLEKNIDKNLYGLFVCIVDKNTGGLSIEKNIIKTEKLIFDYQTRALSNKKDSHLYDGAFIYYKQPTKNSTSFLYGYDKVEDKHRVYSINCVR